MIICFSHLLWYCYAIVSPKLWWSGWLVVYCFSPAKKYCLIIACEGLEKLGACHLWPMIRDELMFLVTHLLWHLTSLPLVGEDHPIKSPCTTSKGCWEPNSNPDPYGANLNFKKIGTWDIEGTEEWVVLMAFAYRRVCYNIYLPYTSICL